MRITNSQRLHVALLEYMVLYEETVVKNASDKYVLNVLCFYV